jgi:hypothetical protein
MTNLLFFILSLVVIINGQIKTFIDDKVISLEVTEKDDLMFLADQYENNRSLDFWTEPFRLGTVDIHVPVDVYESFTQELKERNIPFEVQIDNLQELIEQQMIRNENSTDAFDLSVYHSWDEIQDYIQNEFPSEYPNSVAVVNVGSSYQNRAIRAVKVTTGNTAKSRAIWIQCGIHAREWIAPATCLWIMTMSLRDNAAEWKPIYDVSEVYWVINLNPDGYAYTWTNDRMWRKTRRPNPGSSCVGTDPNRNYDFGYGRNDGSSPSACSETFRGPNANSENEIRTTTTFLTNLANSKIIAGFMCMHSYSQLWLSPWGYHSSSTDDEVEQDQLGLAATTALTEWYGTRYRYGPISRVLYHASGGSVDWAYGYLGIKYSYTPELRPASANPGFQLPPSQIITSGQETNAPVVVLLRRCLGLVK